MTDGIAFWGRELGTEVHRRLLVAAMLRDPHAGSTSEPPGPIKSCLERAAASPAYQTLIAAPGPLAVEDTFDLHGPYTGRIDAWAELSVNQALVIDWKTGAENQDAHRLQRFLYALALLPHYRCVRVITANVGEHEWDDPEDAFSAEDAPALRAALHQAARRLALAERG